MATGYQRPSLSFLPPEVFEEPYQPPNWYLQVSDSLSYSAPKRFVSGVLAPVSTLSLGCV